MKPLLSILVALIFAISTPAIAQDSLFSQDSDGDGLSDGYEDMNGNGTPDGFEGGAGQGNRMETECLSTARPEICLAYFQFNCQYYGFQLACNMASLGNNCTGGDQQACQYFSAILVANKDCYLGNQQACAYLAQQPLLRQ